MTRRAVIDMPEDATQVAVIGMECRFPGMGEGLGGFWSTIDTGFRAIRPVPAGRFRLGAARAGDRNGSGESCAEMAGFVDGILGFDAPLFGIGDAEAREMDPRQRVLSEILWSALERSGYRPSGLSDIAVGTFLSVDEDGGDGDDLADRVARTVGLSGPSESLGAAETASLQVIHRACECLRAGGCDIALAGGASVILAAEEHRREAGSERGEGAGVVVLKRLEDATAEGDRIWAVIRGTAARGNDVADAVDATGAPRRALEEARCRPDQVGYLEVLGAASSLRDPSVLGAVRQVFCDDIDRDMPLVMGSVCASIGHLGPAAGIAGFIKTVLVLRHGSVPPQPPLVSPGSPVEELEEAQAVVPRLPRALAIDEGRALGAVGSFAEGGNNCHVVLDVPATAAAPTPRPALRVLAVSARSEASLRQLASHFRDDFAREAGNDSAVDVCHTAALGREVWPHRLAVLGETIEDLHSGLDGYLQGRAGTRWYAGHAGDTPPRVAFLFAGQGSWSAGTGGRLYMANPVFRRAIDQCADAVGAEIDQDLRALMFDVGAQTAVYHRYGQVAHFALLYALARTWIEFGVEPAMVAGHSLGEHVAACVAGVTSVKDGLYLAAERGRVFDKWSPKGAMLAVAATVEGVEEAIGDLETNGLYLAVENAPTQIVLSGMIAAVDTAEARLSDLGVRVKRISIAQAPGHSPLLRPVADRLGEAARKIDFQTPRIPIISTVTGRFEAERLTDPDHWSNLIVSPVRFDRALRTVAGEGPVCLEIGPSRTLTNLAHALDTPVKAVSSLAERPDDEEAREEMAYAVAALYGNGATPEWRKIFGREKARKAALPPHPMERRIYHVQPTQGRAGS